MLFEEMWEQEAKRLRDLNIYKLVDAVSCWVFPPVGSAHIAVKLLEAIEAAASITIFGNPDFQVQVCSPGQLLGRDAAMLTIAKYLACDNIALYDLRNFTHTFSGHESVAHAARWGKRLTLHNGDHGDFDPGFEWWNENEQQLVIAPTLPIPRHRTDILDAGRKSDIRNVNLVASLLVHKQHKGYWQKLGQEFAEDMQALLSRHLLGHLLDASWVATGQPKDADDKAYLSSLEELMWCALSEYERLTASREEFRGILYEMSDLIEFYQRELTTRLLQ